MQSEKLSYQQLYRMINTSLVEVGPRSLWKGLIPTLWRDIPFSMIYWFHYEMFRGNENKNKNKL
jgi:solute carrier family 25 protein 39/40